VSLLTSPHLIDAILLLTLLEAAALVALHAMTPGAAGRMLLPGIGVMLALRAALAGAAWPWVPMALLAALVAHLFDLSGRLGR
jgi:hypothetical protein